LQSYLPPSCLRSRRLRRIIAPNLEALQVHTPNVRLIRFTIVRWNEAIERVIAASAARDREKPGTPAWEEADADYEAALATYRETAAELK
jgi:hypothetical protein